MSADQKNALNDKAFAARLVWQAPTIRTNTVGETRGGAFTTNAAGDDTWYQS